MLGRTLQLILLRDPSRNSFDTRAESLATLCLRCIVLSNVHLIFSLVDCCRIAVDLWQEVAHVKDLLLVRRDRSRLAPRVLDRYSSLFDRDCLLLQSQCI